VNHDPKEKPAQTPIVSNFRLPPALGEIGSRRRIVVETHLSKYRAAPSAAAPLGSLTLCVLFLRAENGFSKAVSPSDSTATDRQRFNEYDICVMDRQKPAFDWSLEQ
jgi:hypothetical protein